MLNHQILSEPASTRRLKANLSLAIDETMLTRKIAGFQDQINRIKHQPGERMRTLFLKREIVRLSNELDEIRLAASGYK